MLRVILVKSIPFVVVTAAMTFERPARAQEISDALTYRDVTWAQFGRGGVDMRLSDRLAIAPNGDEVYVADGSIAGLHQYRRDPVEGNLEYVATVPFQPDGAVEPYYLVQPVVSPDGRFIYSVAVSLSDRTRGIVRFDRNMLDGSLAIGQFLSDQDSIVAGIIFVAIEIAPDGRFLYLLGRNSTATNTESIAAIALNRATGLMTPMQREDHAPIASYFGISIGQPSITRDGRNIYYPMPTSQGVEIYDINRSTGEARYGEFVDTRIDGGVSSARYVSDSPDGRHVYVSDFWAGRVINCDRDGAGHFAFPPAPENVLFLPGLPFASVAPDGARVYVLLNVAGRVELHAFSRDQSTGAFTELERVADDIIGRPLFDGRWFSISRDSQKVYVGSDNSITTFAVGRPALPCQDVAKISDEYSLFLADFGFPGDIDEDGLPESAGIALVGEASCGGADEALEDSLTNAYLVNVATAGPEGPISKLSMYRHAFSSLMLMSATMRYYVDDVLRAHDVDIGAPLLYVSCAEGPCVPFPEENPYVIETNEPFSGEGDPDADGFTNAQEWANVLARGGSEHEFAVSALDASNDGSTVVSFSSGSSSGSCFIATAAYGTPLAAELDALRGIRDEDLLTNALGAAFTDVYYRLSPPAAQFIAQRPEWQSISKSLIETLLGAGRSSGLTALALALVLTTVSLGRMNFRRRQSRP